MNKVWYDDENQYIRDHAASMNDEQLAAALSIQFNKTFSKGATRKQRQRLGIKKTGHRGHFSVVPDTTGV